MSIRVPSYLMLVVLSIMAGCANITTPTGGKKDTRPPKLLSVTPENKLKNTRVKRIELQFDEYITVNDPGREVQLSPILPIAPTVTGLNKHAVVKIIDSLLEDNTTYRLSFGNSVKDLHEGNPFVNYTYTFSTGDYFDSLQLHGMIKNAETGLSNMEGVTVELYYARENDTAVMRQKPKYVTKADANGVFTFKGLPKRNFRIYAIKDANDNLIYDGPGPGDLIGFADVRVTPGDTQQAPILISVFAEIPDTTVKKSIDSITSYREKRGSKAKAPTSDAFTYTVSLDTSNSEKKSFDITGPVKVNFSRLPAINKDKITLAYDSAGTMVNTPVSLSVDSPAHSLRISPIRWRENTLYTLRLVKGFAKDTAGKDLMPSRYTFRTKEEETDYGRITVRLPGKYMGDTYLLKVMNDNDSVYQQPVTDTNVVLRQLKPGKYTFRVIVDKNKNGKWDTGDLLANKQPEDVIPYKEPLGLKAGWEHTIDFEQKPKPRPASGENTKKQK